MNLDAVAILLSEVRAMYPQMTFVPKIADAWLSVLHDFDIDDCRLAMTAWAIAQPQRIPGPGDLRRLVLVERQDAAMRDTVAQVTRRTTGEIVCGSFQGLPIPGGRPEWVHARYEQAKASQHALNVQRKADGMAPTYGETITRPSDHRP